MGWTEMAPLLWGSSDAKAVGGLVEPRCLGLFGSQESTCTPVPKVNLRCLAISLP